MGARLRELSQPEPLNQARIAKLEQQVQNLLDVMAAQGLRTSAGLTERLRQAETITLKAEQSAADPAAVEKLLPDLAEHHKRQLANLPLVLGKDVTRARTTLATHIRPLTVQTDEHEIRFYRQAGHVEAALLRAAMGGRGSTSNYGRGERI